MSSPRPTPGTALAARAVPEGLPFAPSDPLWTEVPIREAPISSIEDLVPGEAARNLSAEQIAWRLVFLLALVLGAAVVVVEVVRAATGS